MPVRRTQSLSEIAAQKCTNDKLRKQAAIASSELSGKNFNAKDIILSTNSGEINKGKSSKISSAKKPVNSLNKQSKSEVKIKKIQEFSDAANHLNSDSSTLRILTKSESINSLDSLSGGTLEDDGSCVTVAVRVRPFNPR